MLLKYSNDFVADTFYLFSSMECIGSAGSVVQHAA
jgi:hypothetical protein